MRTAAVQLTIRDNLIDYIGTFSVSIGTCLFRHTKNTFLLPTTDSFSLYTSRICNLQLSNTKFRLRGYVVKDLSQLMIQSNQPIDYLINPSHVTSNGTLSQHQIKPVLASATCLRALLWLLLLNNSYGLRCSLGRFTATI